MEILFIHQAFPAQFGHLALELSRRHGWKSRFLVEAITNCPAPTREMLEELRVQKYAVPQEQRDHSPAPWPQIFGRYLEYCRTLYNAVKANPDIRPDLVVAHGGRGAPTLFLPEALDCPIINYCEYCFAREHSDISFRIDLPRLTDVAQCFPRAINAPVLTALEAADAGYSATNWQKERFPKRFWPKIEVHFDGIDTQAYHPAPRPKVRKIGDRTIPEGTRLVTFVARGLESVRGFDLFVQVAHRIARERPDTVFAIAGSDQTYYGWDALFTDGKSFKEWALARHGNDPERFWFLGHILPDQLAELLAMSDLHFYLTVPFVLSWSLINAMSCGCVVLGSDVPPVREVLEPGVSGLVEPFYDVERLARTALQVLDDPAAYAPLGEAARRTVEERYSVEVCLPPLRDYFERVASAGRRSV